MRRLLPDAAGLPRAFWFLWAGIVVNRTTGFIVPYLAIWLSRDHGWSAAAVGVVASLYGGGAIAGALLGGIVADRLGRKVGLLAGLGGSAAAVLALAAAPLAAVPSLVLAAGFFGELYRPASQAAVADLVPPADRDRAFSLVYWGVNLGFAAGGAVAGALASASIHVLFAADAATTLAFAAIVLLRVPETLPRRAPTGGALAETLRGLAATFTDRHFAAFLATGLATLIVFMQVNVALPLDLGAKGFGPATLGALFTWNGVLIGVAQPFAARLSGRFPRGRVLAASTAVVGLGFFLHGPATTTPTFAIAVAVWTLGELAWLPLASTVVADLAPPALRGRYQGAYATSISVAVFAAPLLGPALHARLGSIPFWSAGLAVCLAAAGCHLALEGPRERHLAALAQARG